MKYLVFVVKMLYYPGISIICVLSVICRNRCDSVHIEFSTDTSATLGPVSIMQLSCMMHIYSVLTLCGFRSFNDGRLPVYNSV